jgi:hypothetical protein
VQPWAQVRDGFEECNVPRLEEASCVKFGPEISWVFHAELYAAERLQDTPEPTTK